MTSQVDNNLVETIDAHDGPVFSVYSVEKGFVTGGMYFVYTTSTTSTSTSTSTTSTSTTSTSTGTTSPLL